MWGAVVCVLCVHVVSVLMNITQVGDVDLLNVFSSLADECDPVTDCGKSRKGPDDVLRTVSVICGPSAMMLRIKADLFNVGVPVNQDHVTLGEGCGVTETSAKEFIIHTALTDCGTHYWLTPDSLVYSNVLVYAPVPSVYGVIRHEKLTVPVQCVYNRKFTVEPVSVLPVWRPHLSTHSAEHTLHFTLRLMTSDWQVMQKGVYLLGDVVNMEVCVLVPLLELRVFVEECVATMSRDVTSVPRYKFIQNGCFTDGLHTSSMSHFLPRIQTDKLQLQLHTYMFRQLHSTQIFISCNLKAALQSSSSGRACSYIQGSWRSADGDHAVCESCWNIEQRNSHPGSVYVETGTPESPLRSPVQAETHGVQREVLKQEVQVGPLSISSWSEMLPPGTLEGINITRVPSFKTKRLTAHAIQRNTFMPGSEPFIMEEEEGSVSVADMGVALVTHTPTPDLHHLTAPPLRSMTLDMNDFEPEPTTAVTPGPPADSFSHVGPDTDQVPESTELSSAQWVELVEDEVGPEEEGVWLDTVLPPTRVS